MPPKKTKFDPRLLHHIKTYMKRSEVTQIPFKNDEVADDLMNLSEFKNQSRPMLIKEVERAREFELMRRGKGTRKSKATEEEILSDEEIDIDPPNCDPPELNDSRIMDLCNTSDRKNEQNHSEAKLAGKKRKMEHEDFDLKDRKLRSHKKTFKLEEPNDTLDHMQGLHNLHRTLYFLPYTLLQKWTSGRAIESWLLIGPPGSGKTALIRGIATSTGSKLLHLSAPDLTGGLQGDIVRIVSDAFEYAKLSAPCILHLDKLDKIFPTPGINLRIREQRLCSILKDHIKDLERGGNQVVVIGETSCPERIDNSLRYSFVSESYMPSLSTNERMTIMKDLCAESPVEYEIDFECVAERTHAFVAGDLKTLLDKSEESARRESLHRVSEQGRSMQEKIDLMMVACAPSETSNQDHPTVTMDHLLKTLPSVIPALKRDGFPTIPPISLDDVGGLLNVKAKLKEFILDPIKHPKLHRELQTGLPTHFLLWGPPGCGKTLLAKALANQAGINFISVKGPEILNMYQGESEKSIREIFARAARVPPCIVFFDEIDAVCPRRSKGNDSGSKATIVNTLLVAMDGFNKQRDVIVVGATNRPHALDQAVLRPGRFETILHIGLPDYESRLAILKVSTKTMCKKCAHDVDLEDIAKRTDGFSGADCAEICKRAYDRAFYQMVQGKLGDNSDVSDPMSRKLKLTKKDAPMVEHKHLLEVLDNMAPSVSVEDKKRYKRFREKFDSLGGGGSTMHRTTDIFTEIEESEPLADTVDSNIEDMPMDTFSMSIL